MSDSDPASSAPSASSSDGVTAPEIPERTYPANSQPVYVQAVTQTLQHRSILPRFFRTLALILVYGGGSVALLAVIAKVCLLLSDSAGADTLD